MARLTANIRSYADAERFLAGANTRRLGHNTKVERWPDGTLAVRYHHTAIVEYRPDGRIRLSAGIWRTKTTKDRLNRCSPYSVYSEGGDWAVVGAKDAARFMNGMVSDPDGAWQEHKAKVAAFYTAAA